LELYLNQILTFLLQHFLDVLNKAQDRMHILEGLKLAVENIDEVIKIIKSSKTDQDAQNNLSTRFNLSEKQTKAIVDMRLGRLTGLAIDSMIDEMKNLS
ncbi:DNA gyrase subunit A, partial [Mycoplasmopsis bovis]|uniref:DNA gyrase subunit A n=1 Tax=Mycoplasmopsis bovis TaxID=28903 RepID=UPI003D2B457D